MFFTFSLTFSVGLIGPTALFPNVKLHYIFQMRAQGMFEENAAKKGEERREEEQAPPPPPIGERRKVRMEMASGAWFSDINREGKLNGVSDNIVI